MMRKFKLINGLGKEFDLMRQDAFFNTPEGLGRSRKSELFQTGDFFITTENKSNLSNITGEMIFQNYSVYQEFALFISKKPLKIGYNPNGEWFFSDCVIDELEKAEIEYKTHLLRCKITIIKKSPFYKATTRVFENESFENSKKYPYIYPYRYQSTTSGTIKINSQVPDAPLKIIINSPFINPQWALSQGGNIVSKGKMNLSLETGRLIINSNVLDLGIYIATMANEFVSDAYQKSDFSTERFMYAPIGKSILSFSHEGLAEIKTSVEVREYFDTV